jgi:molybdenum cofactor cytidylyltransferase
MKDIAILLLAAGGSRRMKQCKQLLPFRGKSLLRHAAEVAVAAQLGPVFIVLGSEAKQLQQELEDLPVRCTINAEWEKGIGTSIRAGIHAIDTLSQAEAATGERKRIIAGVLVMLCDQPFIDAKILRTLAQTFADTNKKLVASRYGNSVGVPALFARSYFPQLLCLADNEGAKRIILEAKNDAAIIPVPAAVLDVDTPADYQRLLTDPIS